MNAEYRRLEFEATETARQMRDQSKRAVLGSSADHARFEQQIGELGRKLASLAHGMALVRAVESPAMRRREQEFVSALPKTFHSQGTRPKSVQLPGGVTVTLDVRYDHRLKSPSRSDHGRRGLFPVLLLLGIAERYTPGVRTRMAKAAALLGSYDEAVGMLAGEGIRVCVNVLRTVTAGMGRMLRKLTSTGSLKVAGNVTGRRIVVTADGGRVWLRDATPLVDDNSTVRQHGGPVEQGGSRAVCPDDSRIGETGLTSGMEMEPT